MGEETDDEVCSESPNVELVGEEAHEDPRPSEMAGLERSSSQLKR